MLVYLGLWLCIWIMIFQSYFWIFMNRLSCSNGGHCLAGFKIFSSLFYVQNQFAPPCMVYYNLPRTSKASRSTCLNIDCHWWLTSNCKFWPSTINNFTLCYSHTCLLFAFHLHWPSTLKQEKTLMVAECLILWCCRTFPDFYSFLSSAS